MSDFSNLDLTIFIGYILCMVGFGIWLARKSGNTTSKDYFLASSSLPWWAVGGSLIASNISTEQILGMNGSGYVMGLAIGAYELLAALTLIIVAKYFLPVFIHRGIYTMPQYLEDRFDSRVRTIMAFFWVALFVFVNITSVLYLGGLAIQQILGVPLLMGILGLVLYSAAFSIFGGLKAVVWTDVVQVVVLVFGGMLASYIIVSFVGNGSYFGGIGVLVDKAPEKFDMILSEDNPSYQQLPGIAVLVGGMWIANIYYWGTNQYIIQRALAAKSIQEAQKGVAFAAVLKLLMPLMVVLPGIATFVILSDPTAYGFTGDGINKPDEAFPWVLNNFVQPGLKGLVFAALVAAIGSSISSMVNSASTIFTLDIYKTMIRPNQEDRHYVTTGKISSTVALVIGMLIAPVLGSLDQVFQYIQEYTGLISPGIVAVFLFGIFWKKATSNAALASILASVPLAVALKFGYADLPFLDRMGFVLLICSILIVGISLFENQGQSESSNADKGFKFGIIVALMAISVPSGIMFLIDSNGSNDLFGGLIILLSLGLFGVLWTENKSEDHKAYHLESSLFKTDTVFNISAFAVFLILAAIYALMG